MLQTLVFRKGGAALDGYAPAVGGPLELAFDPEGIVVHPLTGHLIVSDEYGPSVYEINRAGRLVRAYEIPANLLPRNAATGAINFASDAGNTAGKRTNRGFEGLAMSPDGRHVFAMLQSAMLDEGGGSGVLQPHREVRHPDCAGRRPVRISDGRQFAGPGHLGAGRDQRDRVPGARAQQPRPGSRRQPGLAEQEGLPRGPERRDGRDRHRPRRTGRRLRAGVKQPGTPAVPWLDLASATTLAHPSLAALGNLSPEKWEGLAVGPRLDDGSYLVLAGTDNDYSVTQNGTGVQFDVYFKPDGDPKRIQCDIGTYLNCAGVADDGAALVLPPGFSTEGYRLIPGVLHAYKATAADLLQFVRPGRESR